MPEGEWLLQLTINMFLALDNLATTAPGHFLMKAPALERALVLSYHRDAWQT